MAVVRARDRARVRASSGRTPTALLRPKTALKDMFLEVDPGQGRALEEDGRISVTNTLPDVDPDEILRARRGHAAVPQALWPGARGLSGRGEDLAVLRSPRAAHRRPGP